jgi:peptide methionine sulfoxide reductase msrA/msrB
MESPFALNVIFAGGCFWCVEHDLKALPGVIHAVSGYSGGKMENPDYFDHGDHREAVFVTYDPSQTSFKKLCQFFLDHIDPTDPGGQFHDRGESYKTAIFYKTEEEKNVANDLIHELGASGLYAPLHISVDVLPERTFYKAEDYHQGYAEKNPEHYNFYAKGSGRVQFIAQTCEVREQKKIQWKD